jgi:hypothetical protein
MDRERLHSAVCRAAHGRRGPGRTIRPQASPGGWTGPLRDRLRGLCAGTGPGLAHRDPRDPGRRCRRGGAGSFVRAVGGVRTRTAAASVGIVRIDHRTGHARGAARRWSDCAEPDMAVDLLDQRTYRRGADPLGSGAARGERRFPALWTMSGSGW